MDLVHRTQNHPNAVRFRTALSALLLAVTSSAAQANDMVVYKGGVLNPAEYTLDLIMLKVKRGEISDIECIYGYEAAKHGKHAPARVIMRYCAEVRKLPQSMTLLAWMDENGYALEGGPNLESAAKWDRRAAELGDSNAQFNYGLKLLRGHGVPRNFAKGRRYIDMAAANGDRAAAQLAADKYDLKNVVGIDADRRLQHGLHKHVHNNKTKTN